MPDMLSSTQRPVPGYVSRDLTGIVEPPVAPRPAQQLQHFNDNVVPIHT
jgi:hypothetical protein